MASSARIEELQKKFDENPKRYFAPLANEFRKAGDLEQAIALCRAFLPQQPAHMSGHIVFGQALFEAKQHEEARTVFETALSLDPENLIALRYLGDIARETGDIGAATGWYRRVLDADPRNEEIATLLAGLPAAASSDAPAALADAEGVTEAAPVPPEPSPVASAPPAPAAAPAAEEDPGPLSMRESLEMQAIPGSRAGEIERSEEVDLAGLGESAAPAAPSAPAPAMRGRHPDAEHAFTGTGPANDQGFEVMEFVPPERGDEAARPSGFQDVAPEDAEGATPAAFVTETMAELYLQQGFHEEALAVYRQLLAQNPNDVGLRERVEQLASGARSSVGAAAVSDAVIESAQRRRTAGSVRTIRSFLASLAGRRVVRNPDSEAGEEEGARSDPEPWTAESAAAVEAARGVEPDGPRDDAPYRDTEATSAARTSASQPWRVADDRRDEPIAAPRQPTPVWTPVEEAASVEDDSSAETELPWIQPPAADESFATPEAREAVEPDAADESYRSSAAPSSSEASRPTRLSGEMGSVNTLFTGAPVTSDDATAAEVLAGAFLAPEPAGAQADRGTSSVGRPTRAAAGELSLDNVFREPGQRPSSEQRRSAFSFDQFFSEGGSAEGGDSNAGSEDASPDDIAQFNAWLEGLKKK